MADNQRSTGAIEKVSKSTPTTGEGSTPRALKYARKGVHNSEDLKNYLSAILSDLVEGALAPNIANSASSVTGKLLRTVELEYRYGLSKSPDGEPKKLTLTVEEQEEEAPKKKVA